MTIDQDDVLKIIQLMDASDYDELHLEMGDLKLTIAKSGTGGLSPRREIAAPPALEPKHTLAASPARADQAPSSIESATKVKTSQPEVPVTMAGGDGLIPIQSPLLGTFYRSPKPGAPPFIEVGSQVKKDDSVCLIEVMKTFTTVKAGVEGRIAKICAENAQMVEY